MKRLVIEKELLVHNIDTVKALAGETKIIAVLKGNGYGIGGVEFAKLLYENGIDFFAVTDLNEAIAIRNMGLDCSILLQTPTENPSEAALIAENNIIATVGSFKSLSVLNDAAEAKGLLASAHIKIDTGFGRYGFLGSDISLLAKELSAAKNVNIEGSFTHFSNSFGKNEKDTFLQFDKFMDSINNLKDYGINPGIIHVCNSCAFLRFPRMHLDAVRIGSAFLGRIPIVNSYGLFKVAHLEASVTEVKRLKKGSNIGYANTVKLKKDTDVAIVGVGYKDGFGVKKADDTFRFMDVLRYMFADFKSLIKNPLPKATVNGEKARLVGRIGMVNIVLDVTGINCKEGDVVTLDINPLLISETIERLYK